VAKKHQSAIIGSFIRSFMFVYYTAWQNMSAHPEIAGGICVG